MHGIRVVYGWQKQLFIIQEEDLSKNSPTPDEIRAARKESRLSQTAAAALIYSNLRTWQDWEAGKARMHPGLWELFCQKMPIHSNDRLWE